MILELYLIKDDAIDIMKNSNLKKMWAIIIFFFIIYKMYKMSETAH